MAGQTRPSAGASTPSATLESLSKLRQAEQKVISSLTHATNACRALATGDAVRAAPFNRHAELFLNDLYAAQKLIRERIMQTSPDLPFENLTMLRLVEADLAVQRSAHIHRALVRTLHLLDEPITQPETMASAASPSYVPSPFAPTPIVSLAGVAPSPAPGASAPTPITVAVPSPDTAGGATHTTTHTATNGPTAQQDDPSTTQPQTSQSKASRPPQPTQSSHPSTSKQLTNSTQTSTQKTTSAVQNQPNKNTVPLTNSTQPATAAQVKAVQTAKATQATAQRQRAMSAHNIQQSKNTIKRASSTQQMKALQASLANAAAKPSIGAKNNPTTLKSSVNAKAALAAQKAHATLAQNAALQLSTTSSIPNTSVTTTGSGIATNVNINSLGLTDPSLTLMASASLPPNLTPQQAAWTAKAAIDPKKVQSVDNAQRNMLRNTSSSGKTAANQAVATSNQQTSVTTAQVFQQAAHAMQPKISAALANTDQSDDLGLDADVNPGLLDL